MARPEVRVLVKRPLVVGRRCEVTIEVTTDEPTRVEGIRVDIVGVQGWVVGGGKSRREHAVRLPEVAFDLMGAGDLPGDSTTPFDVRFTLPAGAAPSHELSPAYARLGLKVQVELPWRFDARYQFELPVRVAAPAGALERTPVLVRSDAGKGDADRPRLELGLASSTLIAGEVLVGSVALFNLDERRHVDIDLVPRFRLHGRSRPLKRRGDAIRARVELPRDHGGRATPFRMQLAPALVPGFDAVTHTLEWLLVASTDTLFGREVRVEHPVTIVDAAAGERSAPLVVAPRVGDERIRALFAGAAARTPWRLEPADRDGDGTVDPPRLVREIAGGELRLTHAYRGDDGTFLVAQVDHPPLGLGLTVVPGSTLRHLLWRDVEIGLAAWDRAHKVSARFPDQATPLLAAVAPVLLEARALGRLVRWDDDALTTEQPVATVQADDVTAMMRALDRLAEAIEAASAAVTPPPGVAVDSISWRALAAELGGEAALGDVSLRGELDGLPVAAGVEWDGTRPVRLRARAGDPDVASEGLRALRLSMPHPLASVLEAATPDAIVECVGRWPADYVDLELADGVASATLRTPPGPPLAVDLAAVRALLVALRSLVAALEQAAPPPGPAR